MQNTNKDLQDILTDYGLVALLRYSANNDDAAEQLKDEYMEQ